ncbi:MAG: hypothetical protein R3D86_04390 [Emcibacteraceae bacterium]
MGNILLIGDSYGAPRLFSSQKVLLKETWPAIVKSELNLDGINCEYNFKTYRTFVDCAEIIKNENIRYDTIVIGAGIVDIFPRTLPYMLSTAQNFPMKFFRVCVRQIKGFWQKYIYWRPWKTTEDIESSIREVLKFCCNLIVLTTPPIMKQHASENPHCQVFIDELNIFLKCKVKFLSNNIYCIDAEKLIKDEGIDLCLDPIDSHYNVWGNVVVARSVIQMLRKIHNLA